MKMFMIALAGLAMVACDDKSEDTSEEVVETADTAESGDDTGASE